jgi:uncharacterized membrane protein
MTDESLRARVARFERILCQECGKDGHVPAWVRRTEGEPRVWMAIAMVAAIALQIVLPRRFALQPHLLLPVLEAMLLVALVISNPVRIDRESNIVRGLSLCLVTLICVGNAISAVLLVRNLVDGTAGNDGGALLATGAAIWGTNIIAFALWYWELDRGGPAARAVGHPRHPDFLFPQMASPEAAPPSWEPAFPDYLYLSFTNAIAFSPTDVMPFSRWAKMLMLVQSVISIVAIALVISRAVNILQ